MKTLAIDIETYSSVSLQKAGVYAYAASSDFEILLFGYAWDDGPVEVTPSKWPAAMAPRLRASSFACLARNKCLSEVLSEISKTSSSLSAYETY